MASFQAQALVGGPLVQARNFAVLTGMNAGITYVMKRIRGKEDVQSSMVAAFGFGAMFSLVSEMGGPNQAANVVTSGLFFALLVQGGLFKVDLWSVGAILFQLVTGRTPITENNQTVERLTFEEFFNHPFLSQKQIDEMIRIMRSLRIDSFPFSERNPDRSTDESSQEDCLPFTLDDDSSGPYVRRF